MLSELGSFAFIVLLQYSTPSSGDLGWEQDEMMS
jgi:hypothetical protein